MTVSAYIYHEEKSTSADSNVSGCNNQSIFNTVLKLAMNNSHHDREAKWNKSPWVKSCHLVRHCEYPCFGLRR